MSIQRQLKLNHLSQILPEGLLVDSSWLQKQGYSRQLIAKYVHGGWLTSPVRGVYRRESVLLEQDDWELVVASLQSLLELAVTIGGRTALDLHGHVHYLAMNGSRGVHLYGNEPPPTWIYKLPLKQSLFFHSNGLFNFKNTSKSRNKDLRQAHFTEHKLPKSHWSLILSTPERAILELLDELPHKETFHQADMLMEGLSNLRPQYLNVLLKDCRSVKVKRLLLWFAERHNHAWFKSIETNRIDLGSGKRMLVPGGTFNSKYLITVPKDFENGQ
ncbi:MAG: type IV toxin-antitoxin system AbiEi family antitoxin [Cyanobacteria bacterium TGS_CYA1]|nr:type IV toxin-antitoxin system AbiEi family antitoxin [Cyanobacteria bacterium TGS_CYA1]